MSDPAELFAAVDAVVGVLDSMSVRYYVTGSVAGSMYGEYRATNDIDIVVDLTDAQVDAFVDSVSMDFVADADQARDALATQSSFNLIHRTSFLKVDLFPMLTEFHEMTAARAERVSVPGMSASLRVAAREDILLAKLRWYRLGNESSEVQRRDITGLIALNRDRFDLAHLHKWARTLGVDDLLHRFLGSDASARYRG